MITNSLIDRNIREILVDGVGDVGDACYRLFTSILPGVVRFKIASDKNVVELNSNRDMDTLLHTSDN